MPPSPADPLPTTAARSVPLPVAGSVPAVEGAVWYAGGLAFECTQCGNCCSGAPGYVWVTGEDMQKMASYLQMSFDEFTGGYVRKIGARYALTERFNYDCVFLTREAGKKPGCRIYPVRPMQCRTWPFWKENLKSEKAWRRAGLKCPGMGGGERHGVEHIERCQRDPGSPE